MDPSPTPPRRFSHWKTTKRTFTFGKLVGNKPQPIKSPNKPKKNSDYINNKSLQKLQESSTNEAKDLIRQSLNNSKKSTLSSETKKKKLRSDDGNLIPEKSSSSDRDDSAETSSVDKENKDRSQDKQTRRTSKVKTITRQEPLTSTRQSVKSNTSKRKHSVESLDESVNHSDQLKTLTTNQGKDQPSSLSSASESEGTQAKRIKKNKEVSTQSQKSRDATNRSTDASNRSRDATNRSSNAVNKSNSAANGSTHTVNKSNSANRSRNGANRSTNADVKSTNTIDRSRNGDFKSSNAANRSNNAEIKSTNAVDRSRNGANRSTNVDIKSTNVVDRSNNTINSSTNSSNSMHHSSSRKENKNVSNEMKILSSPIISPDNLSLEDTSSRPSSLRNRSLLMSSQAMQEKRQYPLSFYYSSKKLTDKSSDSKTSIDLETSQTNRVVNLSKGKDSIQTQDSISKSKDTFPKNKDKIFKSKDTMSENKNSKSKDTISKNNKEEHDQIVSEQSREKMSVPDEMIQLSKIGQLVVNKCSNLRKPPNSSKDGSVRQTEKHASKKHQHELENESLNQRDRPISKRQSKKPQESSGDSSGTDSQSKSRNQQSKRKAHSKNQSLPENHSSAVKKLKSSQTHKAIVERKTICDGDSSPLPLSNHSSMLKSRPSRLRKSILLSPPVSKQYPISYYYSGKHPSDHSSDKETSEHSGLPKSGQTVNIAMDVPVHSQKSSHSIAEVNLDLPVKQKRPEPKSRKLKAGKVSSSDSVVISNNLMRTVHSEEGLDMDIIAPEPQITSKAVNRKKGPSQKIPPVKSTRTKVKAGLSNSQDVSQNGTVLASQVHQRKRNLVKEFDATQEKDDVSKQSKKGQSREVHVWCEDGRSRPGSDVTAYDVLLEKLEAMEQQLKEDEPDMNSQEMITKVMDDLRSQIESLLLKRLDLKGLERDIRKVKARCGKLKEDILKKQKENSELSSRMESVHRQSRDATLLLASCWMKDYAKLMEALDSQQG